MVTKTLPLADSFSLSEVIHNHSAWFYSTFIEPLDDQEDIKNSLYTILCDSNVYDKSVMLTTESNRKTVLYAIYNAYGKSLSSINYFTKIFGYDLDHISDQHLYDTYGIIFDFPQPSNMPYPEYREVLRNLIDAFLHGSTVYGINKVVSSFTGVNPDIVPIEPDYISEYPAMSSL